MRKTSTETLKERLKQRKNFWIIRRICSTFQDCHSHSRKLIEQFVNKGYKKDVAIRQIQKVDRLENNCSTNKDVFLKKSLS